MKLYDLSLIHLLANRYSADTRTFPLTVPCVLIGNSFNLVGNDVTRLKKNISFIHLAHSPFNKNTRELNFACGFVQKNFFCLCKRQKLKVRKSMKLTCRI